MHCWPSYAIAKDINDRKGTLQPPWRLQIYGGHRFHPASAA